MNTPPSDPRPRMLRWASVALVMWLGLVALTARVYWQGVLVAVLAHGLLVVGMTVGTAIVARRRDPSEPEPEPVVPPEPGAPRRRVPRLEASPAAVLGPGLLAMGLATAGVVYILPEVPLSSSERIGLLGLLGAGVGIHGLVGRYVVRGDAPLPEGAGIAAWVRSGVVMCGLAGLAVCLGMWDRPFVNDLGTVVPVLRGIPVGEAMSVAMCGAVLVAGIEPLARAAPGLWSWWRMRDAVPPRALPAANTLVVRLFFSSVNPVQSVFAVLDETMGIDIRSSWAIAFVRRALEPSLVAVVALGWLTTSLVMVDTDEQAVRERFGRATNHDVLGPGLHLVWPWPVEQVRRVSTERVRTLTIGHEEEPLPDELLSALDPGDSDDLDDEDALLSARAGEAESRLWAKQHADQEYTLLLGDGRDLVTIDALLHYRVRDARTWLYGMQNPASALRSLAYRAVMEHIISQSLDDALGQDFARLAEDLEARIQAEADLHNLGVEVVDFTLGALHPPVGVAANYQGVVSAQILRDTERITAQAYRTGRLSEARREVVREEAMASSFAAERHAEAVGEARAFLGLRAQVRTAEADYRFRRRMEAMAQNLNGRPVVVLDHRLERDGMTLWLAPGE